MKKKFFLLSVLLTMMLLTLSGCKNNDTEDPFNFSGKEPKDINPWTYVEDTSITINSVFRNLAASSSELGIVLGIMGIVFSIFYMVLRIFFSRNAATKEEVKQEAILKGMIAIMLFSIPFWLGMFKQFAELLV